MADFDNMQVREKILVLDTLLESTSSSSDEEELINIMKKQIRKRPKVKNFISEVIDKYNDKEFKKNLRLSKNTCEELIQLYENSNSVNLIRSHGGKEMVSPKKQILAFLWFAGNHVVIRNVAELFDMSELTFHAIISKIVNFLVEISPTLIKFPKGAEELREASDNLEQISNFPNVIGCIDGTYINIKTPAHKIKSTYVNRHDLTSLTLQGICNAEKKIIDVFTGIPGKLHDSRVFQLSFINNTIKSLPDQYHIIGDPAYPLSQYLLTPYRDYGNLSVSQVNYNKKFSATRVLIENAFGILKGRFRQLSCVYFHSVERSSKFILACCVLHNLCLNNKDFIDDIVTDENDEGDIVCVNQNYRNRVLGERKRNMICNYLNK